METIDCEDSHITLDKFKKLYKDVLVKHLFDDFQDIVGYKDLFLKATTKMEEMKSVMINAQKSVIQLQGELLDIKTRFSPENCLNRCRKYCLS